MSAPIAFDAALARIAEAVAPLESETVALDCAAGRTLAEDVVARAASPRRTVSTMDGYAVVDKATRFGDWLEVIGESRAGANLSCVVGPGQAARIFTGAALPPGADRVIIQEHATRDGARILFSEGYGPQTHIRAAGSDFAAGAKLVPRGARLTPRAMIAAAAADIAELQVVRRPKVAILTTGDELAVPGEAHRLDYAIPDSIGPGVAALVFEAGGEVVARTIGPDEPGKLTALAGKMLTIADLLVVTGGASVGEHDFAKASMATHGLALLFDKVAIKPGKPVWFGGAGDTLVLGLPGNPTSAMVTAALFLRPLLARLQGSDPALAWRIMPLSAPLSVTGDRETFVRARWDDAGLFPLGNQDSGAQSPLAEADWLIRCPAGQPALAAGAKVRALEF